MSFDWATLAVGVALFTGAAYARARAHGDRRLPSLRPGLFDARAPTWTWIPGLVSYPLMAIACAALTSSPGGLVLLLGGALLVGSLGQVAVYAMHNRSVSRTRGTRLPSIEV